MSELRDLAIRLERRGKFVSRLAYGAIALILVVLVSGIYVFWRAETVAANAEVVRVGQTSIDHDLDNAKRVFDVATESYAATSAGYDVGIRTMLDVATQLKNRLHAALELEELRVISEYLAHDRPTPRRTVLKKQLEVAEAYSAEAVSLLEDVEQRFEAGLSAVTDVYEMRAELEYFKHHAETLARKHVGVSPGDVESGVSVESAGSDYGYEISVLSTKIGSAMLLVLLTNILVGLYRYTLRLSAFYLSRADMLRLLPEDKQFTVEEIGALLRAESIEHPIVKASSIESLLKR